MKIAINSINLLFPVSSNLWNLIRSIYWIMMMALFHLRVKWYSCSFHFISGAWPLFFILSNQLSYYDIVLFHYDIIRLHSQSCMCLKKKNLYNVWPCYSFQSCFCDLMDFSFKHLLLHKMLLLLFTPRLFLSRPNKNRRLSKPPPSKLCRRLVCIIKKTFLLKTMALKI